MSERGAGIPGPSYGLKSLTGYVGHDFSKSRAPAYSLGLKLGSRSPRSAMTPGPYGVADVDRFGKYPYMGWTIESRGRVKLKSQGPGPLSYSPEKMKTYAPAYSLGLRLHDRNRTFGPSPAQYYPQYTRRGGFTIGAPLKHLNVIPEPTNTRSSRDESNRTYQTLQYICWE